MNIEEVRDYCLNLKGTSESFPFDDKSLVFKVGRKMFGIVSLDKPHRLNLKCRPEYSIKLREQYRFISPGYHMNKRHWNSIMIEDATKPELIYSLIDESYNLVYQSLTKKEKEDI